MSKTSKTTPPKDFEIASAELEGLVAAMESGKLNLEESMTAYRRGIELTTYCQKILADAEQQVKILESGLLREFDPDGNGGRADDD